VDTEKVCERCGKHCVPAQSYCPKCGSLLPAATPVTPGSAPSGRRHRLIVNKGPEEQVFECEDEEQAFNKAMPWLLKGYIARIADEQGVVKWTQAPSQGQIAAIQGDATQQQPQSGASRGGLPFYVWAAWTSPAAGVVVAATLWALMVNHQGARGERPPAVLLVYVLLLLASTAGGLAGVISLFGVRSWRNALSIIPGAVLGICLNGYLAVVCLLGYALEGKNLGG
jgi:uncharacterized membrane protein